MTASLLNGGCKTVCGAITPGSTESIVMSAKAHRQWAEVTKGITRPEIICASSKHAAIEKACDLLRIKLVELPVHPESFMVDVESTRASITENTIMIYASAPSYPHGIIDPIDAHGKLAKGAGIGLHVDCCLGGFYLPFAKRFDSKIPAFDFEVDGVTAMSCDTHKYGYASKGTS